MSYSGNMPDWHQYNPPQSGRTGATSIPQNVNTSHHFISSITPPAIDGINLTNDRQTKHQRNDVNYPRNFQAPGIPPSCPTSTALTTPGGVHMSPLSNCVGHYGAATARNPIMEPAAIDPRMGINEPEIPHRNNQLPFNAPGNHTSTNLTVNPSLHAGGITSQTSPVGPLSPGRQPYPPCKGPCCNPDANLSYPHWDKYQHYQPNATYRDNMRGPGYQMENRRFMSDINLRKDCIDNKEIGGSTFPVDHRRNYDYKYRKEMSRNYPSSSLLQNYQMQNCNFSTDCQKCPHAVKDYMRRGSSSSAMPQNPLVKYPEQQMVPPKYSSKQLNYPNGSHQSTMPNTSTANLPSSLQNYFNAPMSRDVPRDFPRDYQEGNAVNRIQPSATSSNVIHGSYQKYHQYQQRIAMQRFSLENHLRMMARTPGYQNHPSYREYMMKYREVLRLQQNVDCQSFFQESQKIPPTSPNAPVPPINLQFDQNGHLINSSFSHGHYPGMHNPVTPVVNADAPETSPQNPSVPNIDQNHYPKHPDQSMNLSRDAEHMAHIPGADVAGHYQLLKNPGENFENLIVDVDGIDPTRTMTSATDTMSTTTAPTADFANSKEFADKPQLDVRQFLENWDETEEEEGNGASPEVSSDTSPASHNIGEVSHNNVDVVSSPKEQPEQQKAVDKSPVANPAVQEANNVDKVDNTGLKTIEEFASSGAIVQCIQTDSSDIPTIHIVDHLPESSELSTIQTVYGDVTSLTIEQIAAVPIEIINDNPDGGETITLFGQDTGVCSKEPECSNESEEPAAVVEEVGAMETLPATIAKTPEAINPISNTIEVPAETPAPPQPVQPPSEVNQKTTNIEATNLRKQHSFASEESHNPDDISLPDLPMSECTPISTTLNTPIHSDSEESSNHVADLAISTNPIEIVQNSPIISFTHSPMKMDPYGNIENGRLSEKRPQDPLDFDFAQKKNTEVETFEIARRTDNLCSAKPNGNNEAQVPSTNATAQDRSRDNEFYPSSDPLVSMGHSGKTKSKKSANEIADSSNDITQVGDCSVGSLSGNNAPGTPVSRILSTDEIDTGKCPSIIDTEDFQPSDDLDKLCNISLDSSCMMTLMPEDSQEPRLSAESIDGMKSILPITNFDELESSDDQLDKDDWIEVRSMPDCGEANTANDTIIGSNEPPSVELPVPPMEVDADDGKRETFRGEEKKTKYIRSIFDTSEDSQSTGFEDLLRRRDGKVNKDRLNSLRDYRREKTVSKEPKSQIKCDLPPSESQSESTNAKPQLERENSVDEITKELNEWDELNGDRDQNQWKVDPSKLDTCKVTQSFRRTHKDTDVEIHVANINVEKLCDSASEAVDAIEIKINVSRHDKKRNKPQDKPEGSAETKKSTLPKNERGIYCPEKIFPRRRTSNPEKSSSKKSRPEPRRRHSGGHTFRYHRKSTEERNDEKIRHEFPRFHYVKTISRVETSEVSFSEGPISSQDDSQESALPETPCESQNTEEESTFEDVEPSKNPKRRSSLNYPESFNADFDELENMASRSSQKLPDPVVIPGPSTAPQLNDPWSRTNFFVDTTTTMDFDNFDVAPNESSDADQVNADESSTLTEDRALSRRLEECEKYRNPYSKTPGREALEINLNTVPVYTTKDGKIKYSPNPRYTYRVLIMEARQREGYPREFLYDRVFRDYDAKRLHKRRQQSPGREERRRRWSDQRLKQSTRRRQEDTSWRLNRSGKYDRWRERPPEVESDEHSIESSKSEYQRSFPDPKKSSRLSDATTQWRKSNLNFDSERGVESMMVGSINNLTVTSHSYDLSRNETFNNTKCIESRIFNGDELELFARKETPPDDKPQEEKDNTRLEASPLREFDKNKVTEDTKLKTLGGELSDEDSKDVKDEIVLMKPPASVDPEQDSQAVLTDSGLESSTTNGEGSKRSPIWQKGIVSDAEKIPSIVHPGAEVIGESTKQSVQGADKSDDSLAEVRASEEIVDDKVEIRAERGDENRENEESVTIEKSHPLNDKQMPDRIVEIPENTGVSKNSEEIKRPNVDIAKLTNLFVLKNHSTSFENNDLLKGLDLAFPTRQIFRTEKPKLNVEILKNDSTNGDDLSKSSSCFLGIKKSGGPMRRASSDEVKSREDKIKFFDERIEFSKTLPIIEETKSFDVVGKILEPPSDVEMREVDHLDDQYSRITVEPEPPVEHQFEKPEIPPLYPFKAFLSSARKTVEVETPEPSTESEVSHFDDTLSSTQFGSECADSKQDTSSTGVNFLLASSQEAIDATDLKEVRKNLALCALDDKTYAEADLKNSPRAEERGKILPFSGRISSESEDDSNAQDGSPIGLITEEEEKLPRRDEKILTFSGRIQSPATQSEDKIASPLRVNVPLDDKTEETNRLLSFSGKIPSPKTSEQLSPMPTPKLDLLQPNLSPKINETEDRNLTFTGRIQSESPPSGSPPAFDKIPKFIIKKTDCSSRSSSISQIFPSDISAQRSIDSKASSTHKISLHPKIPKMIIRNVRSRPGTPTIEENAVELSFPKPEGEKVFEVKIKLDDKSSSRHEPGDALHKSISVIECKIPKMKIKLEDKYPKMIFENASMELSDSETFKNVPKVKIRKIKTASSRDDKRYTESPLDKSEKSLKLEKCRESSVSQDLSFQRDEAPGEKHLGKIPKLKIRKQEARVSSPSPEPSRRKRPKSPSDSSQKRQKKSSSRHRSSEKTSEVKPIIMDSEATNSTQSLSEKIPKVIIKRTSSTSEFKCELSKDGGESIIKDAKWQPEVKLERLEVLDTIAKDPERFSLPLKLLEVVTGSKSQDDCSRSMRKLKRTSSDPSRGDDMSDRSSSVSRRRHSEPEKSDCHQNSDTEDVAMVLRRDFSRQIIDDTSLDTRSEILRHDAKPAEAQVIYPEDVTRSEFEYPNVSSSHKGPVELAKPIPVLAVENVNDTIVDTKSSEDQSVIKLESSDESQTTIELLPASSDVSQPESEVPTPLEGEQRIANGDMARLYSADAIPTQFELELEIVDNSSESLDVPVPHLKTSPQTEAKEAWSYEPTDCSTAVIPGPSYTHRSHEDEVESVASEARSICCSDRLVKEVLAAKETLKKYLTTSNFSNSAPRTKTAAEKKQFTAFDLPERSGHDDDVKGGMERCVFQEGVGTSSEISRAESSTRNERQHTKRDRGDFSAEKTMKRHEDTRCGHVRRIPEESSSRDNCAKGVKRPRTHSESGDSSSKKMRPPSTSISSARGSTSTSGSLSSSDVSRVKSHKGLKISIRHERRESKLEKQTTEVMPILEPEGEVAFEPSSREASRSPPVITKQDSSELNPGSPKKLQDNVTEKLESLIQQESMTFADIVTQMAYHEKATIKHRRYCILCERWFPTTSRHRRHLSGYQHRHTELTQRRTIHALFMLFTGKPCPRLLPASIVRTECAPGEPTPLQIAVQDVAISLEKGAIDKTKKLNEEDK